MLYCSNIRLATFEQNLCIAEESHVSNETLTMVAPIQSYNPVIARDSLVIWGTYLSTPEEDSIRMRLHIVETFDNLECSIDQDNNVIHVHAENDDGTYEEIQKINQILDKIEEENGQDNIWKFRSNDAHQGSLKHSDLDYQGCRWNVCLLWENGEILYELLYYISLQNLTQ